jgi:NRPS condensation-like uncharacterized protein
MIHNESRRPDLIGKCIDMMDMRDSPSLRVPLSFIDELFALSETPAEPWSVHLEARVGGRLDEEHLGAAIRTALERHPLARARLVEEDERLEWLVERTPTLETLSICRAHNQTQLDSTRSEFLSEVVPLLASPPLRVRLVRAREGDHLILNINHAVCDGLGALRLIQSIGRAYGSASDPVFEGDELGEWRLRSIATPADVHPARAALIGLERFREALAPADRIAPDGGTRRSGYGVQVRALELTPIVQSEIRRAADASVNDILVAALHRAVGQWNATHNVDSDRLSVAVPINVRGPNQQPTLVGNFAMSDTVSTRAADRTDAKATLQAVCRQTKRFKETGAPFADLVSRSAGWPSWLARRMPWMFGGSGVDGPGDCAVLSNLGRGDHALESFGADLPITGLWFSPPVAFPIGVGLGVVSRGDSVQITLRYRWPRLDDAAAIRLLDLLVVEIAGFC